MGKEIEIRKLTFSYHGRVPQLKEINLKIHKGEVVVITGPSGSGKSSLTRVINGLIPYFFEGILSGNITVEGEDLKKIPSWARGKLVGNVFQDPRSQFFANEVAGEIAFGCENYGYTHEEICRNVHMAAKCIGIEDILSQSLHSLSYGMRQKVAIASAQAINPEIYVMDEPSANLDIESIYRLREIIKALKDQGKTIVIAEHRLYYLMEIADRFLCVKGGEIVREFSREQMKLLTMEEINTLGLRSPNLHRVSLQPTSFSDEKEIILEAKNLCKAFGNTVVAQKISFSCHRGETIAVIGPNGTGKSTLGRILTGLLKEDSGDLFLFGKKTKGKERLGNVWYIPQDLDSQLFGEDLLDELLTGAPTSKEKVDKAKQILRDLNLSEFEQQHPATLSGGQKQRLALGVALMHNAPVIILDEPTSGLDGANMRNVSQIIKKIAKGGHIILVITHDAECALSCCERVIRLEQGCITDDFMMDSVEYLLEKIGYNNYNGKS